jgi:hypothetical protein
MPINLMILILNNLKKLSENNAEYLLLINQYWRSIWDSLLEKKH